MKEKRTFSWPDIGPMVMEVCGGKLALDLIDATISKPIGVISKGTAFLIGAAAGNFAFINQVDPLYRDLEKLIADIKETKEKLKEKQETDS